MDSLLAVRHLTKKFHSFTAAEDITFDAHGGEIFGLLGPNGAGKTTTLRTIATALQPTSGTATVAGFDILRQPEEVKKHIGVLTTDIGVYDRLSGRENLEYFGELYGMDKGKITRRITELADLLEMNDFIDRRAGKYSTGMKQKLAIARSVIHDPEVLIFDEPTSGLDVLASQTVLKFMRRAKELGKCVVLSTHQMIDAERLCDRVAIIHQGRMIANDTVANILVQAGAADLEEAFLKLVRDVPKPDRVAKPALSFIGRLIKLPRWVWSMAQLLFVVMFLIGQYWAKTNPLKVIGYIALGLAIVLSTFQRYYLKKKR